MNGKGKFIYQDGSFYEGEFKNGNRNGYGIYKYNNGDIFKGEYKDGKRYKGKEYNGDEWINT